MAEQIRLFWWDPNKDLRDYLALRRNYSQSVKNLRVLTNLGFTNFGDAFSKLALEHATGRKVTWSKPSTAEIFAVGSVLKYLPKTNRPLHVWGSGDRGDLRGIDGRNQQSHSFLAVRGTLTHDAYGLGPEVTLGDPGLFIRELVAGKANRGVRPLYIPHFSDLNSPDEMSLIRMLAASGYDIVLPNEDPLDVAEKVRIAKFLVTTTLHGRVFADALGIPVFSIENISEPSFKFRDYVSAIGTEWVSFDKFELWRNINFFTEESAPRNDSLDQRIDDICDNLRSAICDVF